tara:strand:+ start:2013 stop:2606 length:594 start_codon:yes stop_codon:yes gene_type:complete
MFNGIIFNSGQICKINRRNKGINLFLKSSLNLKHKDIGSSISLDGVCLTLISVNRKIIEFYLSKETINKSKFKNATIGDKINIELPLKYGQNISGHICQGHVDTIAEVSKIKKVDKSKVFEFKIPNKFKKSLVEKASILVNGVSLTISKLTSNRFEIWVIPHTLKLTNLSNLKKKDLVNIEIDILSKYIKKLFNEKK